MIIGVTGHRDAGQKPGELEQFARLFVARVVANGATEIITGMARGWDLAVAEAADAIGIPFLAALPFPGQDQHWSKAEQVRYFMALRNASRVHTISRLPLNNGYIKRDRWIVDHCDELHALDSGRPSGSHTTVLYAEEVGRKVVPLWDDWTRFQARR